MQSRYRLQKKSQAALFLIIGIVLVMVAVSFFVLSRYAAKKASKQEIIDSKEASFDVQPVKNFVTECLSSTSKSGLELLGRQGGYLFKSQGGLLIDYPGTDEGVFFIKHENVKVAYNILGPRFPIGKYVPAIPRYPWRTFPYEDASRNVQTFEAKSAFGVNNLPPLNQSFGQSMQQQLEAYTENNIGQCLDFSIFAEQGLSVTEGEKEVEVDINENDVAFRMSYSIIVESLGTGEKTLLKEFLARHNVRLGKLHRFVNSLIESDISDIKFNIIGNPEENSFGVDIQNDAYNNDDLLIITDRESSIGNQQYKYYFARKNRNPALFYLAPEEIALPALNAQGELTVITEDDLLGHQELIALDPDEDFIGPNSFSITPQPPIPLLLPRAEFKVGVTDGSMEDYQIITVRRG